MAGNARREVLSFSAIEAPFLELLHLAACRCMCLAAGKAQSGFLNSDPFLLNTYRDCIYLNYPYKR